MTSFALSAFTYCIMHAQYLVLIIFNFELKPVVPSSNILLAPQKTCDLSGCYDCVTTLISQSIFRPGRGGQASSAADTSRCFCHYHVIIPIMRPGSRLHRMICPMSDPEQCQDKCVRYPGPVTSSQLAVNALWRTSAVCAWCNPVSQLVIHSLPWSYVNCSQSGCFNCTHTPARGSQSLKFLK